MPSMCFVLTSCIPPLYIPFLAVQYAPLCDQYSVRDSPWSRFSSGRLIAGNVQVENLHVVINILLVQLHFDRIDWILVGNIFQSSDFVFETQNFGFEWRLLFFSVKKTEIWNKKTSPKPPTRIWKIKKRFSTFWSAYHFGISAISDLPIDQVFSVEKFTKISPKIKDRYRFIWRLW